VGVTDNTAVTAAPGTISLWVTLLAEKGTAAASASELQSVGLTLSDSKREDIGGGATIARDDCGVVAQCDGPSELIIWVSA